MRKFLLALATFVFCHSAQAQVCNDPSGFLKSNGPINIGDVVVLGPDCQHLQDIGGGTIVSFQTRAIAATQNLSNFAAIRTLGYNTAGDGGAALFKNVGQAAFLDSYIAWNGTQGISGGSGYTNGAYTGAHFSGGSAANFSCTVEIVVAGGAVTQIAPGQSCAGFKAGDVLTMLNTFIGGTGSGFTYTVPAVTAPQASFIDAAGNHWQFVADGEANVLQFGCVPDWNGNDATATNNSNCLWSALAWGSNFGGTSIAVGAGWGAHIIIPRGGYMTCGTFNGTGFNFIVPNSVRLSGASVFGSVLKECAADPTNIYYMALCNTVDSVGEFGCKVEHLTLNAIANAGPAAATVSMLFSNSGQQMKLAEDMEVEAGVRTCVFYSQGLGGAANDVWEGIDCVQTTAAAANPGYIFQAPTAQHSLRNSVCASTGAVATSICIQNLNGRLVVDTLDIEGYAVGLQQNVTTAGDQGVFRNVQQNSNDCSEVVQLVNGNTPSNLLLENIATACPITVLNSQPGGVNFIGNIFKPILCPGGACA